MNNSRWVLDELKTWLNKSFDEVSKLKYDTNNLWERDRLQEKESTLRMVYGKVLELEIE